MKTKACMLMMIVGLLVATSILVSADGEGDLEAACCDASIEVEVQVGCLDRETGVGTGSFVVRNTGEQGISLVSLAASLTRGTGMVVPPIMLLLPLEPGGELEVSFAVIVTETPEALPDGAQVKWEVTGESCRPDHNIGKSDTQDFPWCPPTAITLSGFTASSNPASEGGSMTGSVGTFLLFAVLIGGGGLARWWWRRQR